MQYVTQWHTYLTGDTFPCALTTQAWDQDNSAFWVIRAFQQISPHCTPPPHPPPPLLSVLSHWRQRGQNKTSKQLQNSPDTNSFPHVTWRGLAGSLDCSDSGMSQPPTLCYLITSGGDGMPFWQSDYGQSDRLKRSQMGGEFTRAYLWVMLGSDEMRKWELI